MKKVVICFNQSCLTSSLSASCIRAIAFSCFSSIFFSPIFLNIMSVLNMYFFPDLVLDFGEMKQLHSYLIINFLLHAWYSQEFQIFRLSYLQELLPFMQSLVIKQNGHSCLWLNFTDDILLFCTILSILIL